MINTKEIIKQLEGWVRHVGKLQVDNIMRKDMIMETKSSAADVVTEIDKKSEEYLISMINTHYPDHCILSEESGKTNIESDFTWIIDPLDGTTNYSQGIPIFAISVALQFKGETQLGVIYTPMIDYLFSAVKGEGAYLNGKHINISQKTKLNECVIGTGFPYDRATHPVNNLDYISKMVPKTRGTRRLGSAAFDLACVAAGILDGYWEMNLNEWDICAGVLLVKEAGGIINEFRYDRGISLIAANAKLSKEIYKIFNGDIDIL